MSRFKNCLLVALIIIAALLGGCGQKTKNSANLPHPKEVQLTDKGGACGSSVGLNAGDTLVLILEGTPSTEYVWEVGFYVPQIITPNNTFDQSDTEPVGLFGVQTFRFLATGGGQATLRMIYHNPMEKDAIDLKNCDVTVDVK